MTDWSKNSNSILWDLHVKEQHDNNTTKYRREGLKNTAVRFLYYTWSDIILFEVDYDKLKMYIINPRPPPETLKRGITIKPIVEIKWNHRKYSTIPKEVGKLE